MRVNFATLPFFDFSRREFLRGAAAVTGAYVLGAYIPFSPHAWAQEGGPAQGIYDPNFFLRVDADNSVTLISKHLEMGQGIATGMSTLLAEELGVDWSAMRSNSRRAGLIFITTCCSGRSWARGARPQQPSVGSKRARWARPRGPCLLRRRQSAGTLRWARLRSKKA